jgi:Cu-Zn family superoxide dismutase
MRKVIWVLATLALLLSVTGLSVQAAGAQHASAVLRDANDQVIGFAEFVEDATGIVHVNVHVKGLTPGLHGIHIHAIGNCTPPAFTSAGGHHNPLGHQHGLENPNGPHAGDLPNLAVNPAGVGHLNATTDHATLSSGPISVFDADGSALVIHADTDDQLTDPTGNSGGRIACGVIEAE